MTEEIECLLTQKTGSYEIISHTLRDDISGVFKVVRHQKSGHVQLYPLPSELDESEFYNIDAQTVNFMGKTDLKLWQQKSIDDTERRADWLSSLVKAGKVLDVGCGYGFFVNHLVNAGYDALGIDISDTRISLAKKSLKGNFLKSWINQREFFDYYQNKFKVVTLFHVLEHVRNPIAFLKQCFDFVMTGGYLLIEVPNFNDELLEQQQNYRDFYWQKAHLSYFNPDSLSYALTQAGFDDFTIRCRQRYGLRNLLNWLDHGKPQLMSPSFHETKPILLRLEKIYKQDREQRFTSDTLIVEVRK